ncbi:uncharacterized protein C05D11.1-like [Belonocnema kinseyi]|uniref:uncharacterized protein C05D11.1-like n=1 Tax=Belonocnema kinseyi TaxID=2817044 RepID=UPI00143D2D62|nr:uncharacterized protein C05D11.1-like [Belonocnema kinseyi]
MAPVDNTPAGNMGGFELICSIKSNDTIPVHKYKSQNTGITVFIADVDGPLVCGYFCLATEAFDDDGLPHTLEHLIFIGSEEYPYKGVLDLFANRCLASGTNAHTDVDNTVYSLETAGPDGFLCLMPIYLEHILYPNLKDSAYITEVHHITGEGEDGGIVYSEMQGSINTGERLTYTELLRASYPGKCGYKSITGGDLPNLRESTSNEKVKEYHKEFYRPENLTIVITGQVKHADVFKALQPIEGKILSKGPRGPFKRPWQDPVPPLTESVDLNVYYPCDDEDNGIVIAAWRGPSAVREFYELKGCTLLLKYLTDTSVSPLQQEFVEVDDPFANNVGYNLSENSEALFYLEFDNVPTKKIPLIKDRLTKILKDIESKKSIDMKRMKTVIYRYILETLSNMENNPHDSIAYTLIGDILFGNSKEDLDQRLNQIDMLKKLMEEPASYWLNLLNKYFISAPVVFSKGIPSIEKKIEMAKAEKERIAKQIESLGKDGLEKKERELHEAIMENEKLIPSDLLKTVPIPSTDSINFHHIKSFSTDSLDQHPRFDVNKIPLYTYLDHVNTNFVYMFVTMDTLSVPENLRPYLPLLLESILACPVNRDGKLIQYEEIVAELECDTVAVATGLGFENSFRFSCGVYSHAANLLLQVELSKYTKGVQWIKELLYKTEFPPERLKIIAAKIINDVAQMRRKGYKITGDLLRGLFYKKESNHYTSSLLRQQKFLTQMMERMNTVQGQKEVVAEINDLRKILTSTNSMALYMAVNVDKLVAQNPDVYSPWKQCFSDIESSSKSKLHIIPDNALIKAEEEIALNGCVTGLGCIESAYMVQCSNVHIKDYLHQDLAPLLVYLQYLTQTEGPMWKQIRGQGLSYGYNMYVMPNEGLLYLSLYKATNVVGAYKEARAIIELHLSENKWDSTLFDSAKSSLIFEIINREKTVGDMVTQSLLAYYRNVPHDYNRQMVKNISAVTLEDIHRVAPKYIKQLLDPKSCITSVVCHPGKASEVADAFTEYGHDLKVYNSLEETYLSEW